MVGTALCQSLKSHELITPKRYELNVGNINQVMKFKADCIIHTAAETDHEYCDENPSNCYFINTIGTANMTKLAKLLRIPIIYVSAGSVFDGAIEKPYTSDDQPNPVNHYNSSKFYGELICGCYEKGYIIRAGWMFGGGPRVDKKFVNKIIEKIKRGDKEIKVCDDCIGSPTYTKDFAQSIQLILEGNMERGIYHFSNSSTGVSRYEFACEIIKLLKSGVKILPCKIDDLKEEFPCKRTNYEVIKSDLISRDWKDCLKEYIHAKY